MGWAKLGYRTCEPKMLVWHYFAGIAESRCWDGDSCKEMQCGGLSLFTMGIVFLPLQVKCFCGFKLVTKSMHFFHAEKSRHIPNLILEQLEYR
jgi:hypothetical protein